MSFVTEKSNRSGASNNISDFVDVEKIAGNLRRSNGTTTVHVSNIFEPPSEQSRSPAFSASFLPLDLFQRPFSLFYPIYVQIPTTWIQEDPSTSANLVDKGICVQCFYSTFFRRHNVAVSFCWLPVSPIWYPAERDGAMSAHSTDSGGPLHSGSIDVQKLERSQG